MKEDAERILQDRRQASADEAELEREALATPPDDDAGDEADAPPETA
jgi:hypothetical protein